MSFEKAKLLKKAYKARGRIVRIALKPTGDSMPSIINSYYTDSEGNRVEPQNATRFVNQFATAYVGRFVLRDPAVTSSVLITPLLNDGDNFPQLVITAENQHQEHVFSGIVGDGFSGFFIGYRVPFNRTNSGSLG